MQHSKAQSSISDSQMFFLALLVGASLILRGPSVSAAVAPNEAIELQQLASDKLIYQAKFVSNRQQQPPQVSANDNNNNDLPDQPEPEPQVSEQKFHVPPALPPLTRQHQQQSPQQRLVSQGVINGNHATYVAPPADFKPIIYDHAKQMPNQLDESTSGSSSSRSNSQQPEQNPVQKSQRPSATDPVTVDPLMATDLQRQQSPSRVNLQPPPQQQQQPSAGSGLGEGDKTEESYEASTWLKPSVGRWNDWHDMSIEPDLASSDSAGPSQFYLAPPQYPQYVVPPPSGPYRTRYGHAQRLGADYVPPQGNKGAPMQHLWSAYPLSQRASQSQRQPMQSTTAAQLDAQLDEQQRLEQAAFLSGQAIGRIALLQPAKPQWIVKRLPAPVQKTTATARIAKGGQQMVGEPPAATSFSLKSSKLPLNLISSGKSSELNSNQQQQQAAPWQPSLPSPSARAPASTAAGKQHWKQTERKLKRRRKSKTNAEVRIQQLVAASQQAHQLQLMPLKQVNGLSSAAAAAAQRKQSPANVDQQEQPQVVNGQQQQQPLRQQQAQANIGERVLSKQQPERPMIVVKRFGSFPLASQSGATNSTTHKRAVRKRRVKTLAPVGLSSWFLGGIRDLDGRHWHLPADIAKRLAVNDVDFSNYQAPKVGPPAVGSVVIIGEQSVDQPAGSAEASAAPSVPLAQPQPQLQSQAHIANQPRTIPISQLIPR